MNENKTIQRRYPLNFHFRSAKPDEAKTLSELSARSKAHWPYDNEYLALAKSITHVYPEDIENWPHIVATDGETIFGFTAICEVQGEKMLDHLWIEPAHMRKGIGCSLFYKAIEEAKKLSWRSFTITSDPFAEPFYLKMGATRIGERESKIKTGFFLPLLEFSIS
jgi:predicted N-acetyltransferase YhbS